MAIFILIPLGVGDVTVEAFMEGDASRISPEALVLALKTGGN